MIVDGLKLLVVGMGYVVLFLAIMVLVIMMVAKAIKPFAHLVEEKAAPGRTPSKPASQGDSKNLIAAAIAAVHMHRNKK